MEKSILKFLEFNGTQILFAYYDGQFWIALKPICTALEVNWNRQFKRVKNDNILKDIVTKYKMRDAANKMQKMICLPEEYIYGWLLGLRSKSETFEKNQKKFYDIFYDHFHGDLNKRRNLLITMAQNQIIIKKCEEKLSTNPDFIRLMELQKRINKNNQRLLELDKIIAKQ